MISPLHPIHPQLAVSASIFRGDKVLLVRRANVPGKGLYSLPGGRVEFGETLHVALHREVDEETGLRIEIIGLATWREVVPGTSGGGGERARGAGLENYAGPLRITTFEVRAGARPCARRRP